MTPREVSVGTQDYYCFVMMRGTNSIQFPSESYVPRENPQENWAAQAVLVHLRTNDMDTFFFMFLILLFCLVSRMYYFAIQYFGECWGAPDGTKYDKHGEANNCWSGVGGSFSNYVYRLF